MSAPRSRRDETADASVVRSEETLEIEPTAERVGAVAVRKHVETERTGEVVPRQVEHADVERIAPGENDSGQIETLPDGSVSIPVLEEELVVTKRTVVRERIVIRKRTITEEHRVEAELRRERVELDTTADVDVELGDDAEDNRV